MSRICTICARGGSKGVKNKNTRLLLGKPLISHTINQAKLSGMFDYIVVSSDSIEILKIAKESGADILVERPNEMATDQAAKLPAIQHCVKVAEGIIGDAVELIVDMDATSPLRMVEDIQNSIRMFEETPNATNLITGSIL